MGQSPFIHPILFAFYPVAFLWSHNLSEHPRPSQIAEAVAMMALLGLASMVLLWIWTKDVAMAAIGTSVILILFSVFGRFAFWIGAPAESTLETILLVAWVLIGVAAITLLRRTVSKPARMTSTLNLVAIVLVGLNAVPLVVQHSGVVAVRPASWRVPLTGMSATASGPERDVYYLIFDRYANERTLRDMYGFDNSAFTGWLSDRGFAVIHDALANYPQTTHSLGSSMNMTYLDDFAQEVGVDSGDWGPLRALMNNSELSQTFQSIGYKYVHIGSWWAPTWSDPTADKNYTYGGLDEFSAAFRDATAWGAVSEHLGLGPDFPHQQWERVHFQVDALHQVAADPGPTFTFTHFTLPHPPYVFHADGSYASPDSHRSVEEAYLDQLRYTNTLIEGLLGDLLSAPGPAPIIVIQSDEGPHPPDQDSLEEVLHMSWATAPQQELDRKLRILNAYYLPGDPAEKPYPTITPVNSFRLIFDDYFGGHMPLLPDRTYIFDDFDHPYRFQDVTTRMRGG